MSILPIISGNIQLIELNPEPDHQRRYRRLFLTQELYEEVFQERDEEKEKDKIIRYARLEVDLSIFVISPTLDPYYLKRLESKDKVVWTIRSVEPDPQLRIFGLFAKKDIFIATHLVERPELDEAQYEIEIKRAQRKWRITFPGYDPLASDIPNNLFSGALPHESYCRR